MQSKQNLHIDRAATHVLAFLGLRATSLFNADCCVAHSIDKFAHMMRNTLKTNTGSR